MVSTCIDVISLSDHALVHLTLQLLTQNLPSWRLNEALLQSVETRSKLLAVLRQYFSINRDSVDNPLVVWEAHKAVVRGTLIDLK